MYKALVTFWFTIISISSFGQIDSQTLYDSARKSCNIELAKQVRVMAAQEKNERLEANSLYLIAYCYKKEDKLYEAVLNYMDALQLYRESKATKEIADVLENIGNTYLVSGYVDVALNYYHELLNYRQQLSDSSVLGLTYCNIGKAYIILEQYLLAIEYYNKARDLGHIIDDEKILRRSYDGLGISYRYLKEYESSVTSYKKALQYVNDIQSEAIIYHNWGYVYLSQGDTLSAKARFKKVISLLSNDVHESLSAYAHNNLGLIYKHQKSDSAKWFFEKGYAYFSMHQLAMSDEYFEACKNLKEIAFNNNEIDKGIYYSHKIEEFTQSLLEVRTDLKDLYNQYQVEAATYKYDNQEKAKALQKQLIVERYITISLVILSIVLVVLAVLLHRKNRRIRFTRDTAERIYQVINS